MKLFLSLFCFALLIQPQTGNAATRHTNIKGLYSSVKLNNNTGILTKAELAKYPKLMTIMQKPLRKGFVYASEIERTYKAHRTNIYAGFAAVDRDNDGKLTFLEVVDRAPWLATAFATLDQEKKGYLAAKDFFQRNTLILFERARSSSSNAFSSIPLGLSAASEVEMSVPLPADILENKLQTLDESNSMPPSVPVEIQSADDECTTDECMDVIVVTPSEDDDFGGGFDGDPFGGFDTEPIVIISENPEGGNTTIADGPCQKACTTTYNSASATCRSMAGGARVRAICWAAAAARYGVCLAAC